MLRTPNCSQDKERQQNCVLPDLFLCRRPNDDMARPAHDVDMEKLHHLERRRRYKARCAIRRRDEQVRALREEEYLREFITEYESLHRI